MTTFLNELAQHQAKKRELERYLATYPDKAFSLAIAHYEDYLALSIKYRELEANPVLCQANFPPNCNFPLPLEFQLKSDQLRHYLLKNPTDAVKFAIVHFENFVCLCVKYSNLFLN